MAFGKKSEEAKGAHAAPEEGSEAFAPQAYRPAFDPETGESTPAHGGEKKSGSKKVVLITVGVVVVLLGAVYAGGSYYFQSHFFPNTKLGSIDVSFMDHDQMDGVLSRQAEDYKLEVSGNEFELTLKADDLGFSFQKDADIDELYADRNPLMWPAEIFANHDVTSKLVATCDDTVAGKTINKAVRKHNRSARATKDATIRFSDKKKKFVAVSEEYGTMLDTKETTTAIEEAVVSMKDKLELGQEHLVQPAVKAKDSKVKKALKKANKMIEADVTLKLGEDVVSEVDAELISDWVILGDKVDVSFDTKKMSDWVETVAKSCDTVGTERTYKRPDGKKFTVSGGDYGWAVDHTALINLVKKDVSEGKTASEQIPTTSKGTAYKGVGKRDWGKRYVDVDLGEQHVYFYNDKGKLIWQSDCVSSTAVAGRATPTGVYSINLKESPSTLVGYKNGKKDYETKVSYWMPFIGNSIGLHDANWRGAFGGSIYKSNGSHGCVNLPVDKAKKIYGLIELDDVVVVHY